MSSAGQVEVRGRWAFRREADATYVETVETLDAYPRSMIDRLRHWASEAPERWFLARRDASGQWRGLTFAEAFAGARSVAAALIDRGLSAERPVAILAGNSLEHGLMALGCLYAGIPWSPVSPSYSQSQGDLSKLRHVLDLITPGLVMVDRAGAFARALDVVGPDIEIVAVDADDDRPVTAFASLLQSRDLSRADAAESRVDGDSIAKFLLTSGSTGMPKAVINTHRMLAANQQMVLQTMPSLALRPPVLVDWLPWNHTFGGNKVFGIALYNGGTLYIDDGKPVPARIGETMANLLEVSPTLYFNVPVGYELLLSRLEVDADLRRALFQDLDLMFYAGAGLRRDAVLRLEALAAEQAGRPVHLHSGLGATETGPHSLWQSPEMKPLSDVGLPSVGVALKLAVVSDKVEARLKGPNITPGYWRNPDVSRDAFDDEGFYRLGDALRFVDPTRPERGLVFDGRIAEDFKLSSGTWVSAGPLRATALAALKPLAWDVVVAGLNRADVRLLIFPDFDALRALAGDLGPQALAAHPLVHQAIAEKLALVGAEAGTAGRPAAALVLVEPPSLDEGELTDKGSISQRGVLARREAEVERLYDAAPSSDVVKLAVRRAVA